MKAAQATAVADANASNNRANPVLPTTTSATDVPMHSPATRSGASSLPTATVPSVDDLLSQLNSTITSVDPLPSNSNNFSHNGYGQSSSAILPPRMQPQHSSSADVTLANDTENRQLHRLTFRQSLPVLSDLGEHPTFVASIQKVGPSFQGSSRTAYLNTWRIR